jgi:hypothetical protein
MYIPTNRAQLREAVFNWYMETEKLQKLAGTYPPGLHSRAWALLYADKEGNPNDSAPDEEFVALLREIKGTLPAKETDATWSFPATMQEWATRFDRTIRTLQKWRDRGVLIMKPFGNGEWQVDVHSPPYVKWEQSRFAK